MAVNPCPQALPEPSLVPQHPPPLATCRPYRRLGGTVLRDRLLTMQGYRVVSVPFFTWRTMKSDTPKRLQYLRALLEKACRAPAASGAAGPGGGP